MQEFTLWIDSLVAHLRYTEIFFLMALESSLFPVPSELVMIPAGYRVALGELNGFLVLAAAIWGGLLWASGNYALGKYVGKSFLLTYGKYFGVSEKKYMQAETLFLKNSLAATFIGRWIPGIRHFTSIPPGVFQMRVLPFLAMTALGAGSWDLFLMLLGYFFGEQGMTILKSYLPEVLLIAAIIVGVVAIIGGAYYWVRKGRVSHR